MRNRTLLLSLVFIVGVILGVRTYQAAISRPTVHSAPVASAPAEQEGSVQWSAPNPPPNPVPTRVVPATRVILPPLGQTSKYNRTQMAQLNRWRGLAIRFTVEHPDEVYLNGQSEDKIVTLTFDDGPNSRYTPKILDILKTYEAPGTFFFIGQDVKAMPKLVRRAYEEGNLVLNHTWDHKNLLNLKPGAVDKELNQAEDAIYQVIGRRPAIMRPPYGGVDTSVIGEVEGRNDKLALWSLDTFDWLQHDKEHIVQNVVDNVRPGDIILMHTNSQATVDALPEIILRLRAKGYRLVGLAEMLGVEPYKKEN